MMIPLCSLTMVYPLQKPSPHHTPCIKYFEFDNKTYRIKQGINKSHILVHCISEIFKIHLCSHVPTEFFYNELTTGFLHLFVISLICQNPVQVSLKRRLYSYYPFSFVFSQKNQTPHYAIADKYGFPCRQCFRYDECECFGFGIHYGNICQCIKVVELFAAKNGADCYSKNGDAVTVLTWQS